MEATTSSVKYTKATPSANIRSQCFDLFNRLLYSVFASAMALPSYLVMGEFFFVINKFLLEPPNFQKRVYIHSLATMLENVLIGHGCAKMIGPYRMNFLEFQQLV